MTVIRHLCTHCLTDSIALTVLAWTKKTDYVCVAHLSCPRCGGPSATEIRYGGIGPSMASLLGSAFTGDPIIAGWEILRFWPDPPSPNVPEHLPADVERVYLQAERNFPIEGNEDASGTMYRKALDIGLKQIDPTAKGMLGQKIKALASAGKLTTEIAEWSDHVRELGNEAAHDAPQPSRHDLQDLRSFTEMVLRYLFTLPGMVRKRREEASASDTTPLAS